MDLLFEWDEAKDVANQKKHGVSFEEAKTVFNDRFSLTIPDPDHSKDEEGWIDTGSQTKGICWLSGTLKERNGCGI